MSNTKTIDTFFSLLCSGLWGGGATIDGRVDWDSVYQRASEQSVLGLVLAGIEQLPQEKRPSQEVLLQMIGEVQIIEQQNISMNRFIAELVEKMRRADIYTLLVKGQGIAQCFDRPLWRSSGDVDFFLSSDNYTKAKEYLVPLAESVDTERGTHYGMTIDSWVVELHGHLSTGLSDRIDNVIHEVQYDCFNNGDVRSWSNGNTQVILPSIDNDVIFIFTHCLKHFYKGGLGLRQICDWCRLLYTYRDSLNHGLLESRIRKMGLMSEWEAFASFAVNNLGMPVNAMPMYSDKNKWKKKADRICSFVMKVGNMGHNRDMSYYSTKSYVIRKTMSMSMRISDLISHAMIFPMDSLRFFPKMMLDGVRSAIKGY